jgi:U3 small nucleolar RNA-associated protein 7
MLTEQKIKDKKLRGNMQKLQKRFGEVAYNAAQSEMLLPEDRGYLEAEGMEKTYKITQKQLRKEVDITTAQKVNLRNTGLMEGI